MAEYEIGDKVYTIPDGTPQATVNDILNQITLGMANQGNNQQQGTDGVFAFAADQAQKMGGKGLEAIGRATGLEGVEKYGTGVVKQQEKDIAEGGYKSKYTKSFSDTWDEDGLDAAFGWVGEKVAENSMTTGASLVGAAATATAALVSAPAALLFGGATLVGSAILGTGEVAGEIEDKTGSYDPNLAVGVGAIIGILDKFGAGKVIPKDQLAKLSAKQIAEKLQKAGFGKASKEFTKRTLKKGGIEFGTEATQESLSIGASAVSGGEYTGKEVKDRLIDAGVIGGSMGSGVSVGTDAVTGGVNTVRKVKDGVTSIFETKSDKPSDPDGATELANMLTEISEDNSFDLQDLDKMSQNGARVTVDTAHKQINWYMKQRIKELKAQLKITDIDEFELVEDKILANVGFEEARNKTKNIVGVKEFKSVDKLVGKLREGQELLKYMRMSNELSKLHNSGYQQGLSRITDNFSPIGGGIGYDKGAINTEKVLRPIASGGAAITTGGASLLGQLGIVAGGRAIDKLRGVNKSVVDQYIQDNKDGDGITTIKDPSIRQNAIDKAKQAEQEAILAEQQAAQEKQDLENLRMQLDQENAPPTPNSPQFTMEDGTGLTKEQVEDVFLLIEQNPNINPTLKKSIDDYRNSVRIGGKVSNLSDLMRAVNSAVNSNGIERTNPQNQSLMQPMQQGGGQQSYQNNPNYQRGIDDNKAFADELIEAVNNDTTLSVVDKPILTQALLNLKKNLGSNPIETGTKIIEDLGARLKNPEAIQQFVVPYLQRVTQQQPNQQQQQAEVTDDGIDAMAEPEFNEGDPILSNVVGLDLQKKKIEAESNEKDVPRDTSSGHAADGVPIQFGPPAHNMNLQTEEEFTPEGFGTFSTNVGNNYENLKSFISSSRSSPQFKEEVEFYKKLIAIKGNPNADITVYRASPTNDLRSGDLITPIKSDAKFLVDESKITTDDIIQSDRQRRKESDTVDLRKEKSFRAMENIMGMLSMKENTPSKLFEYKVKAKDIRWDGNNGLIRWGYFPDNQDNVKSIPTNFNESDYIFDEQRDSLRSGENIGILNDTTNSQTVNPSRIFPTNTEINSYLPTIKKVLEVGKKGSPQETGLSREEIMSVGNALGYAMVFVKNKAQMAKLYGKDTTGLTGGFHQSSRGQYNFPIKIVSMQQGYKNPNNPDQKVSELDELWILSHEIAHGLSQSTNQRGIYEGEGNYSKIYQGINYGEARDAYLGTLEQDLGEVIKALTDSQYVGTDEGVSGKIIKEIMNIQNNTPLMSLRENALGNTKGTRIPRSSFSRMEQKYILTIKRQKDDINETQRMIDEEQEPIQRKLQGEKRQLSNLVKNYNNFKIKRSSYTESIPELLADAVGAYLMSPQQFKSVAPNTAKFIRDNLNNKPSSKFVKFYAHPLGTILAVIMAAFAMGDDKEEEQPQMQPGALDLGQGALSA